MVQFDWLGNQVTQLVYWKCVLMVYGVEYATDLNIGVLQILKWSVSNLGSLQMVKFITRGNNNIIGYFFLGSYTLEQPYYFPTSDNKPVLGQVDCVGTEMELFQCFYFDIGRHLCSKEHTLPDDVIISCYGRSLHH